MAPKMPPIIDDMYAALSARPASPFFAIGKPSSTVAAEAAPPGTPNRIAGIGSPVAVVAPRPSSSAKAEYGSMLNVNGSSIAVPVSPPIPGMMPSMSPMMQPSPRNIRRCGSINDRKALPAETAMKPISAAMPSIPSPPQHPLRARSRDEDLARARSLLPVQAGPDSRIRNDRVHHAG